MNRESLEKARELIQDVLNKSNITPQDKVELMINLNRLLSPEHYDKDIQVLKLHIERR